MLVPDRHVNERVIQSSAQGHVRTAGLDAVKNGGSKPQESGDKRLPKSRRLNKEKLDSKTLDGFPRIEAPPWLAGRRVLKRTPRPLSSLRFIALSGAMGDAIWILGLWSVNRSSLRCSPRSSSLYR